MDWLHIFRSSPIKNTHYACLKMTAANGMIAFPNQCGTIRLFEAKTLKEYIENFISIRQMCKNNMPFWAFLCRIVVWSSNFEPLWNIFIQPIHDFESSPVTREYGKPAFTPTCFITNDHLFYSRLNNGTREIVKCG